MAFRINVAIAAEKGAAQWRWHEMAGNTILTIDMITREAVRLWRNTNAFVKHVPMQYDDYYAKSGAKIGDQLRIRLPNDYTVRTGPAAQVQDTSEQSTMLVLATQKGVDVSFSTAERTMKLQDYSRRVLAPMINNLAGMVAVDVMGGAEGGVSNLTANISGGTLATPTAETWLDAGAILDIMSETSGDRKIIADPRTNARTVSSLAGLLNPAPKISQQYRTGSMGMDSLGFDWFRDQTVIKHTTGSFNAVGGAASSADQTGLTLAVSAITGDLNVGDIITIDGVNSVNRITKQDNGSLAQFVITEYAGNGSTTLHIYPAIVPAGPGGAQRQYQTVKDSPDNGAQVRPVMPAGSTYINNIAFGADAVTMATADLELPRGVHEAHRESFDGLSMRMVTAYNVETDQMITRLDILYGFLWIRPEWAVSVPDVVSLT